MLIATGVGGPVGLMLVSVGISMAYQKHTKGSVDPLTLALDVVPVGKVLRIGKFALPALAKHGRSAGRAVWPGIKSAGGAVAGKAKALWTRLGGMVTRGRELAGSGIARLKKSVYSGVHRGIKHGKRAILAARVTWRRVLVKTNPVLEPLLSQETQGWSDGLIELATRLLG